jgi:hypothetical protein
MKVENIDLNMEELAACELDQLIRFGKPDRAWNALEQLSLRALGGDEESRELVRQIDFEVEMGELNLSKTEEIEKNVVPHIEWFTGDPKGEKRAPQKGDIPLHNEV